MPGQVVDPALLPQLGHDGVDPGEACLALGPLGQGLGVAIPGDLDADGVPLHAVEPGVVGGRRVKELSPQELPKQGEWGRTVPLHLGAGAAHGYKRLPRPQHLTTQASPQRTGAATSTLDAGRGRAQEKWQKVPAEPSALAVPTAALSTKNG